MSMNIENLIELGRCSIKGADEVECKTIVNNGQRYKIIDVDEGFEVIDVNDNYPWGKSVSIKGAVINAMNNGIRLKDMNFNGHWVPVKECIQAVRG